MNVVETFSKLVRNKSTKPNGMLATIPFYFQKDHNFTCIKSFYDEARTYKFYTCDSCNSELVIVFIFNKISLIHFEHRDTYGSWMPRSENDAKEIVENFKRCNYILIEDILE